MENKSRDYIFFNLSLKERFLVFLCISYCRFEFKNGSNFCGFTDSEFNLLYKKMVSLLNIEDV